MDVQVWILSADEAFARMLTVELEMLRLSVLCNADPQAAHSAEIVLLDLDTAFPPPVACYRRMIGFTRNSASAADETRRLCSLILRRPFELRRLREEVFSLLYDDGGSSYTRPASMRIEAKAAESLYTVSLSDGRRVSLSPKEHAVLSLLVANRGMPISREAISKEIGESSANKADVYICLLRKKLESADRRVILTVRGRGYQLL